jgi:hypothetical protein
MIKRIVKELNIKKPDEPLPVVGLGTGSYLTIAGLAITIISTFIINFIQVPILDYQIIKDLLTM